MHSTQYYNINIRPSMDDQINYEFWFKITPTEIVHTAKDKPNLQKNILIKLGNKQAKSKGVGKSIELVVDVLYSRTLNKYCPIKGIIKVYDVQVDGSEMIFCVGAFNTEDLLSDTPKLINISRDLGPCKVYLTVQVRRKEPVIQNPKSNAYKVEESNKRQSLSIEKLEKLVIPDSESQLTKFPRTFNKSPRILQGQCLETPYIIDDSSDFAEENSQAQYSQYMDDCKSSERDMIGEELIEQRRKNRILEQKYEKANVKIQLLRKNVAQKNNQLKNYYQNFKNFTAGLESDSRGQYIFEMNEKKREMSLRYKPNIRFKQVFEDFIAFIIKKMSENAGVQGSQKSLQQDAQINKLIAKIQQFQNSKKKGFEQRKQSDKQVQRLKKQLQLKNAQLGTKSYEIKRKQQQIFNLQVKLKKMAEQLQSSKNVIQHFKQRDRQLESSISTKQNIIESLKRLASKNNADLLDYQQKNKRLLDEIQNLELTLDQMKEQNANLMETIDGYRQKYGDLKALKDKALEREIKQCLRWIELQNRDEELSLQDTTLAGTEPPAVTSIMRSISEIENIENMPLEQISAIRKQVMNVLKRLDEFVAKNSVSGM